MHRAWLLAAGVLCLGGAGATGQDKLDKYLTKDGKLKQALVVRNLQSGFAGVTGREWTVEPSGEWKSGTVFKGKTKEDRGGKLSPEELKALAGELAKYHVESLESKK